MEVADKDKVDKARLKALGAAGVIEVGNNVQAVFGTQAEFLKNDIKDALAGPAPESVGHHRSRRAAGAAAPGRADRNRSATSTSDSRPGCAAVRCPCSRSRMPTFAQGIVGHGAAIDPPREIVDAVAPISGKVLQMFPHAYIIVSDDNVGVLVHLGLDTVQLKGEGFTAHVGQGDRSRPASRHHLRRALPWSPTGRNPIVPVVVMEKQPEDITLDDVIAAGGQLTSAQPLIAVTH